MPRWELPDADAAAVRDGMFEDDFVLMICVLEADLSP